MRCGIDSIVYMITCVLSTMCLAACSNSLHQRNIKIGEQSRAAAAGGIHLILATNDLTAAGFALSTGAGGIAVGTLILFIYSLHIIPVTPFQRKIFFFSPLMLVISALLSFASGIAVTYIARHGTTSIAAFIGKTQLPTSVVEAQARASGIPLDYWSNGYVKFMAISPWPMMPFVLASIFFAYRAYQVEKPSAQVHEVHQGINRQMSGVSGVEEKGTVQHIA